MTVQRMDNVAIVVADLDAAIAFFTELGLALEGRARVDGDWAGRVTGLRDQRVEIAMLRTPDGHGRLELSRFDAPAIASDHRRAPVNSLGYLRAMFAVDDLDDTLVRLGKLGGTVVDEVVDYQGIYRLCYLRGPEGILVGLAQQLGQQAVRADPLEHPGADDPAVPPSPPPRVVIDHIDLRVRDLAVARRFFEPLLATLELRVMTEDAARGAVSFGTPGHDDFGLHQSDEPTRGLHVAFAAPSRAAVDRFHAVALALGGVDNGAPGYRPQYHRGYYGAFVLDAERNNLEAVFHERPAG